MARDAVFMRVDETAPIDMTLTQDCVAVDISGFTELGLLLTPQDGSALMEFKSTDSGPLVSVISATLGQVRFSPTIDLFATGMVQLVGRWYVILASKKFYYPQDDFFELRILRDNQGFLTYQRQILATAIVEAYP